MTTGILEELKAIGVEVILQGNSLAIRPASKVPPGLKQRLRQHKAEVLAVLKAQRATRPATATTCRYDWKPGYEGLRLHCVTHHHGEGTDTVFRVCYGGYDTLLEMLERGFLTGQALKEARRPQ